MATRRRACPLAVNAWRRPRTPVSVDVGRMPPPSECMCGWEGAGLSREVCIRSTGRRNQPGRVECGWSTDAANILMGHAYGPFAIGDEYTYTQCRGRSSLRMGRRHCSGAWHACKRYRQRARLLLRPLPGDGSNSDCWLATAANPYDRRIVSMCQKLVLQKQANELGVYVWESRHSCRHFCCFDTCMSTVVNIICAQSDIICHVEHVACRRLGSIWTYHVLVSTS